MLLRAAIAFLAVLAAGWLAISFVRDKFFAKEDSVDSKDSSEEKHVEERKTEGTSAEEKVEDKPKKNKKE